MAVMLAAAWPGGARAAEVSPDMAARLAPLLPAVVNIEAFTLKGHKPTSFWGSGFFVDRSGLIVTNRHVVAGADRIRVTGRDFAPQDATLVYVSRLIDLAVLKVEIGHPVPVLAWGDSDALRIGQPVFAIGNPLGIGISVSAGIVSGLNRNIRETRYDDFIQTDAAINHGNSGGPMVDEGGRVVGIDTALYSSPHNTGSIGIGFALPARDAAFIANQLVRGGKVHVGWAGMEAQRVDNALAQGLGLRRAGGSVVASVAAGGPAAQAGIGVGDVLLRVDGQSPASARGVLRLFAEAPVGQLVPIEMLHDGAPRQLAVMVAEDPDRTTLATLPPELPSELRTKLATPDDPGMRVAVRTHPHEAPALLVTEVDPNGAAADAGIARDELILRVRQRPVATPTALRAALQEVARQGADRVALLVQGRDGARWAVLRLAPGK
ncbi:MAG TPA: trypsin-like peptidase domain-containing protein [Acetobacteraceae bacterium]|nr:trypsin-like peptidase domain-containing protein [Acetobacteraceae bacterium]